MPHLFYTIPDWVWCDASYIILFYLRLGATLILYYLGLVSGAMPRPRARASGRQSAHGLGARVPMALIALIRLACPLARLPPQVRA